MQLSCMKRLRKDFTMSNEREPTAVQDNVIFVPFKLQREICTFVNAGGFPDVAGAATGCGAWVINTIFRLQKRKEIKKRLFVLEKDPA